MRTPSCHHRDADRDDRTMTPMIDIVFLLLIFFVCAAAGQVPEVLMPTELGAGALPSEQPIPQEKPLGEVWIRLLHPPASTATTVELNDRQYTEDEKLRETLVGLATLAPEIPVILDIDDDVPLGDMIRVYDICRSANFDKIQFAADPQTVPKSAP